MRNILILAAHDDGSGAHVTIRHLVKALIKDFKKLDSPPLIVYLNSSNFEKGWAKALWFGVSSSPNKWLLQEPGEPWSDDETISKLDGIWINCDHGIRLGKLPDGKLDVAGTRQLLSRLQDDFHHWGHQIRHVPIKNVSLAIDMGVPQLPAWAEEHSTTDHTIKAISIGDMFWSRTLSRSLEGAGEYDEEVEKYISYLHQCEVKTSEVWALPLCAAQDYIKLFRSHRVPYNELPGFFGPRKPQDKLIKQAKENIGVIESKNLVVVSSGSTPVWNAIYDKLADIVEKEAGDEFALLTPSTKERGLQLIDNGKRRKIPDMDSMLPYFACSDFGVTRGGITTTEFIACQLPFIIVQEPDHWLSRRQQSQTRNAGLCHSACLSRIQDPQSAFNMIQEKLNSSLNPDMSARMGMYQFGVEKELAEYLIRTNWESNHG